MGASARLSGDLLAIDRNETRLRMIAAAWGLVGIAVEMVECLECWGEWKSALAKARARENGA